MALIKLNNQSLTAVTSAGLPSGTVLQVVQGTLTATPSTTLTSFQDSGLFASITPTSTSSKILVIADFSSASTTGNGGLIVNIMRDSTQLIYRTANYSNSGSTTGNTTLCHLDEPSTTSAITYKVQYTTQSALSTAYFNYGFFWIRRPNSTYNSNGNRWLMKTTAASVKAQVRYP
jgi:hypothetical protein